ncbi:MAG: diguanylate cyclase, partial [Candidatus Eremiobacterota bacterium]
AHVPVVFHSFEAVEDDVAVSGLEAGANDFLQRPCSAELLAARVSSQVAIYKTQMALRERVLRDELTGVFSRRYLFESMRQHVSQFSRPGPPVLACLMVDVDHFKLVNDRLGHLEGDRVLKKVAGRIYAMTRKGDVVARFGGEEFVVILPATSADGAGQVAEKLRVAVEEDCHREEVTISVGVSWHETRLDADWEGPGDEEIINMLLARADEALYRAKADGRNCVRLQSEYTGEERRRHPRVDLPMTIEMKTPSGATLERRAQVSAGGMAVTQSEDLRVGDQVELILHVGEPVHALGVVVWAKVGERCGITFKSFEGNGQEQLIRFLGHRTRTSRRRRAKASGV